MKYSVLYYPKFEPSQKWLRSTLLFVDEIQRIIPADARHVDSEQTLRMLDLMPGVIRTIPLDEGDKHLDEVNLARLEKAFALIQDQTDRTRKKPLVIQPDTDGVSVLGGVWLSRSKVTDRVQELLIRHNLADIESFGIPNPFDGSDTFPVIEEAANLVVSYIADRMAMRTGLDTITDVAIPHTVHSLDAMNASVTSLHREGQGLLAATVANLAIPDGIERFDVHEFQELHESFQEIREPFHSLIHALSMRSNLDRQQSGTALQSRIERAVADYQKQMNAYKKNALTRKINKWAPICFQGLLGVFMALSPEMIKAIEATGVLGIQIIKEISASQDARIEHEDAFRMLCQLDKIIDQKKMLSKLV